MTISLPRYKIEIAFASTPFGGSLSWTDVTTDVQLPAGISIQHGRPDQFSQISAGQAKFTLDNITGTYSPGNAGSTLSPNVILGKAVRIRATEDGTTFAPRYFGYVDSYTVSWNDETGLFSNVDIVCVDLFALMALRKLPTDIVSLTVNAQTGLADYWKFNDPAFTTVPVNFGNVTGVANVNDGLSILRAAPFAVDTNSAVDFGNAAGVSTSPATAVQVTDGALSCTGRAWVNNNAFYATGFFRVAALDSTFGIDSMLTLSDGVFQSLSVWIDGTGKLKATISTIGGTVTVSSTASVNDTQTHAFGVLAVITGGHAVVTLYLDGVIVATDSSLTAGVSGWAWSITSVAQSAVYQVTSVASIVMAHLATYPAGSVPDFAAVAAAGLNGFSGETPDARFTRLAGYFGITPTIVGTFGTLSMGPINNLEGTDLFTLLQQVQDTENGVMYVDTAGNLTLAGRNSLYNQTASLTLTSGMYEADLQFLLDKTNFLNDVTATGSSGAPQEYSDATSVGKYGQLSNQFTLDTTVDAEALAFAQNRVGTGNPQPRAPQIHIDLMSQQALVPTLLTAWWACDLGDLIAISGMPTNGVATSTSLLIQGWTETLTDNGYDAVINTSAAPAGVYTIGDATWGTLDGPGVIAY